jgi:hypothetical protein
MAPNNSDYFQPGQLRRDFRISEKPTLLHGNVSWEKYPKACNIWETEQAIGRPKIPTFRPPQINTHLPPPPMPVLVPTSDIDYRQIRTRTLLQTPPPLIKPDFSVPPPIRFFKPRVHNLPQLYNNREIRQDSVQRQPQNVSQNQKNDQLLNHIQVCQLINDINRSASAAIPLLPPLPQCWSTDSESSDSEDFEIGYWFGVPKTTKSILKLESVKDLSKKEKKVQFSDVVKNIAGIKLDDEEEKIELPKSSKTPERYPFNVIRSSDMLKVLNGEFNQKKKMENKNISKNKRRVHNYGQTKKYEKKTKTTI